MRIAKGHPGAPDQPWSLDAEAVAGALDSDPGSGLDSSEIADRRQRLGSNQLPEARPRAVMSILVAQLRGAVVYLLLAAAALAAFLGDWFECIAILSVLLVNSLLGFVTELRATRSMEALRQMARSEAIVLRNGEERRVSADDVVVGDIVLLEAGDVVPADLRLLSAAGCQVDEAALTGESLPVSKDIEAVDAGAEVFARSCMVYRGTAITRGNARGVVTAVGTGTEFGRIFESVRGVKSPDTPLEQRLDLLGSRLALLVVVIGLAVALAGVLGGRELWLSIQVAVALSVAAIPEGLPVVATIALARGMWVMAGQHALVRRLSAVETLGATDVIMTDKTGTLTENRMRVTVIVTEPGTTLRQQDDWRGDDGEPDPRLEALFTAMSLCNKASYAGDMAAAVGDPTELALLRAANEAGVRQDALRGAWREAFEDPFDPDSKRMATVHAGDSGFLVSAKGAPEAIVPLCTASLDRDGQPQPVGDRGVWLTAAARLGADGLRTLAIAGRRVDSLPDEPYDQLVLYGIVAMEDPPRDGVAEAISACRTAGIDVHMVTGDHEATAKTIAGRLDIDVVHARVTPERKLELITEQQAQGHIVAMTGDGVNDAPALKQADIGIAMGERGTAVAREASAMVLQDDRFETIVSAVREGRAIFQNIQKFVVYLLSCNVSEVLVVSLATLVGGPLPLLPLQILFLNLVTDVFPALALGAGRGSEDLMLRRPRPSDEEILSRRHYIRIALYGLLLGIVVLGARYAAEGWFELTAADALTVSFLTIAFAQLWHVFNMRRNIYKPLDNEVTRNPWVWSALLLCIVLILSALHVPIFAEVLELTRLPASGWLLVMAASIVPLLFAPLVRWVSDAVAPRVE